MREGWEYKRFTDVVWFQEGPGVRNTQYTKSGIKLLNVSNLVDGKLDLSNSSRYISEEEAYGKYKHFLVNEGDFIIASSGIQVSYFDKKMGFAKSEHLPLCMNTSTIRFKVLDDEVLDICYFMYYLKSETFKSILSRQITGSAQLNFGPSHIKRMSIPLPPLSIQQSIVAELDEINNLLHLKKKELETFDKLAQSIFYEMFGDPVTNEKGWEVKKLREVCSPKKEIKRATKMFAPNDIIEYIDISSIDNSTQKMTGCTNYVMLDAPSRAQQCVQYGDIIVSTVRPNLKNIAIVDSYENNLVASSGFCVLRPSNIERNYLFHFIISDNFTNHLMGLTTGANYPAVRDSDIIASTIPIPPLSLQQTFATRIETIEQQKEQVKASINKLETLLASRMQYWFD